MLDQLVAHIAQTAGIEEDASTAALGIIMNAAERQGSPFADAMYTKVPGARTLAATMGSEVGAATGEIARLIEQTPGGRRHVAATMISDLHTRGLGHKAIGELLPAIATFAEAEIGLKGFGHLGDLLGSDGAEATQEAKEIAAA